MLLNGYEKGKIAINMLKNIYIFSPVDVLYVLHLVVIYKKNVAISCSFALLQEIW